VNMSAVVSSEQSSVDCWYWQVSERCSIWPQQ